MKQVILFLLCVTAGVTGAVWYFPSRPPVHTEQTPISPTSVPSFSIQDPPADSLQGVMTDIEGDVSWQSRTATAPARLTAAVPVRQGELIQTSENASVRVTFSGGCTIDIGADARLDVVQTLPKHVVLRQDQGILVYSAAPGCPLTIRTRRLLTVVNDGVVAISLDSDSDLISVRVRNGSAQVAYNNAENISSVTEVKESERFLFDNVEREGEIVSN